MFVGWYKILFFSIMPVDAHVIGDAVMVVAHKLIDAVDDRLFALASVGQAEKSPRMAVKIVFLPLVWIDVLIRIVEIFAGKRARLVESINRSREVNAQKQHH